MKKPDKEVLRVARETYVRSGEVEIDNDADMSYADDGCWVSAWVWVPYEEENDE